MNLNKKGFTLIELLAVIVVLAIVTLIGVNSVLPQMDKARKKAFALEGNAVKEAASTAYVSSSLTNQNPSNAYSIKYLIDNQYFENKSGADYKGCVVITPSTTGNYSYKIYLSNGNFMINGVDAPITDQNVVATDATTTTTWETGVCKGAS